MLSAFVCVCPYRYRKFHSMGTMYILVIAIVLSKVAALICMILLYLFLCVV